MLPPAAAEWDSLGHRRWHVTLAAAAAAPAAPPARSPRPLSNSSTRVGDVMSVSGPAGRCSLLAVPLLHCPTSSIVGVPTPTRPACLPACLLQTDAVFAQPDTPLNKAAAHLRGDASMLPVLDAGWRLVGLLSQRECLKPGATVQVRAALGQRRLFRGLHRCRRRGATCCCLPCCWGAAIAAAGCGTSSMLPLLDAAALQDVMRPAVSVAETACVATAAALMLEVGPRSQHRCQQIVSGIWPQLRHVGNTPAPFLSPRSIPHSLPAVLRPCPAAAERAGPPAGGGPRRAHGRHRHAHPAVLGAGRRRRRRAAPLTGTADSMPARILVQTTCSQLPCWRCGQLPSPSRRQPAAPCATTRIPPRNPSISSCVLYISTPGPRPLLIFPHCSLSPFFARCTHVRPTHPAAPHCAASASLPLMLPICITRIFPCTAAPLLCQLIEPSPTRPIM